MIRSMIWRWLWALLLLAAWPSSGVLAREAPAGAGAEPVARQDTAPAVYLPLVVQPLSEVDAVATVQVPAGDFLMGCTIGGQDPDCRAEEQPQRTIFLNAFAIDAVEVTNARYRACVSAGVCAEPYDSASYSRPDYFTNPDYDDYPVVTVDWEQADAYCRWAGKRLPTEAEWEKAARGDDARIYPWGNLAPTCDNANFGGAIPSSACAGDTSRIGAFPNGASPYEALDMAGNVHEWVSDWYADGYHGTGTSDNPQGPATGTLKVLRGGGWYDLAPQMRAAGRMSASPLGWDYWIGFRCVRPA